MGAVCCCFGTNHVDTEEYSHNQHVNFRDRDLGNVMAKILYRTHDYSQPSNSKDSEELKSVAKDDSDEEDEYEYDDDNDDSQPLATKQEDLKAVEKDNLEEEYDITCPTCFEEYTPENPKMMAKCGHHYHLGCIYEWLERSPTCPACQQVMEFEEA